MNKILRIVSTALASLIAVTSVAFTSFAEDFTSATELIADVINTSVADIESSTKDTALTNTLANITVDGEAVSYEGEVIGYYDVSTPNVLYADAEKSSKVVDKTAEGYDVNPVLLSTILTDLNAELKDSYTPTDMTDWSQIIGKYDITFGEGTLTIPAEQWLNLPDRTTNNDDIDELLGQPEVVDLSEKTGKVFDSYTSRPSAEQLRIGSYVVTEGGDLWISNACMRVYFPINGDLYVKAVALNPDNVPSFSKKPVRIEGDPLHIYVAKSNTWSCPAVLLVSDVFADDLAEVTVHTADVSKYYCYLNINNPSLEYNGNKYTEVQRGIFYYTQDTTNDSAWQEMHSSMIVSQAASKTVVGNTDLSKKILKLNSLSDTDTLSVTSTDWLVNGESIADFLGAEFITESGSSATIDTPTEIEPMAFNVVVPASLPIYVDSQNTVFVADNAVISNYSCAPVAVKSVEITPKPNSGWQMVDTKPSPNRDGMEFTFATSLTPGTVLGVDENVSFTYSAKLSPYTVGTASLDLATVKVTVCWADELTP